MSQRKIENCIHILYIAVFVYIVLSLAVATARIDYPCKRTFHSYFFRKYLCR